MIEYNGTYNWLRQQVKNNYGRTAVTDSENSLTYGDLYNTVKIKAAECKSVGITKGEPVFVPAEFNIEFVKSVLALWEIGAVPVPVNANLTEEEIMNMENQLPSWLDSDIAVILFTSGTSGIPKGVALTFANFYHSVRMMNERVDVGGEDKWLASLPFSHISGFSIITRTLLNGGSVVIPNNNSTKALSAAIEKHNPNFISLVPTMLQRFIETGIQPHSGLKAVFIGGAPSDKDLLLNANKAGWKIHKVYGTTETCAMVTMLLPSELSAKAEAAGKPFSGVRIMIDENNKNEIIIESPTVAKEYVNDVKKSLSKKVYRTNDSGSIDDEGYLYVHGRIDGIIITGGENVNPLEVEEALLNIIGVKEAHVFPMEDAEWGQSVNCAVVVDKDKLGGEQIRTALKEKLVSYKVPKRVFILAALPKTSIGKIDKQALMKLITPDAT